MHVLLSILPGIIAGPQSYLPLSVESFVKGLHIIQIGASDFSHAYMNLKMNTDQIKSYLPGVASSIGNAVKVTKSRSNP
jgi:hypothetical protein